MQAPATPLENDHYIPGMRVEIRDAEWRLKRVDRSADGGYLLECVGQSELVRGRSAQFLTRIEQNIRVLDPARTRLVDDLSDNSLAGELHINPVFNEIRRYRLKATAMYRPSLSRLWC